MGTIELSAIIPATDAPATLARCLAALRAGSREPDELIVVDSPAGAGPAAARNLGAARARGRVLVFVDSDVEVHADALGRIEDALAGDRIDAVFGSYDDDPAQTDAVSSFRNLLHHHVHTRAAGPAETFWAGLGAVRRDAFERTGGFNAAVYPEPSIEDVELGVRMRAAGYAIELDPAIRGRHLKRWTLRSMLHTDMSRRAAPWVELAVRGRGPAPGTLNSGPRHRLSAIAALVAALALIRRRPGAATAATLANVAIHPSLYSLLARRGGPRLFGAGLILHPLHALAAVAALPIGLWRALR